MKLELIVNASDEAFQFAINMGFFSREKSTGLNWIGNWQFVGKDENGYCFERKGKKKMRLSIKRRIAA